MIEADLCELIFRETSKAVTLDDDLDSLGLDSLEFVSLIQAIEKEFSCDIPDSEFARINTVRDILERI